MKTQLLRFIPIAFATLFLPWLASGESAAEIRHIIAQSICLAEGYPNSQIAKDAEAVAGAFMLELSPPIKAENLAKLRKLAKLANPGSPTIADQRNFAIAKCVSFSHQKEVQKILTHR